MVQVPLENTSKNMLIAATNAFIALDDLRSRGHARNPISGEVNPVPVVTMDLRSRGVKWCIIGGTNYGKGSSREHAALEPRFLGGVAIVAKSFARIHKTNLKEQGMLPLTFDHLEDYDRIVEGDRVELPGLEDGEMLGGVMLLGSLGERRGRKGVMLVAGVWYSIGAILMVANIGSYSEASRWSRAFWCRVWLRHDRGCYLCFQSRATSSPRLYRHILQNKHYVWRHGQLLDQLWVNIADFQQIELAMANGPDSSTDPRCHFVRWATILSRVSPLPHAQRPSQPRQTGVIWPLQFARRSSLLR